MKDLKCEDKKFLVDYCMTTPKNTWLALAIGQIQPEIKKEIVSSFVRKLDISVKEALENIETCGFHWETCVPETKLEAVNNPIYLMIMKDRGIKIHLGLWDWTKEGKKMYELYVGTPVGNEACPPKENFEGFLKDPEKPEMMLEGSDCHRRWWFVPIDRHRYIRSIEALSELNDDKLRYQKIKYFTDALVRSVKAISRALEV